MQEPCALGPPKSSSLVAWERVRDAGSPPVLTHPDPLSLHLCFAKIPMWFALGLETLCSGFQTKSEDEHHLESALKHTAGPRPGGLTQWVQVSPRMCLSNEFPGDAGLRATQAPKLGCMLAWEVSTPPAPMKRCGSDTEHLKSSLEDAHRQQRLRTSLLRGVKGEKSEVLCHPISLSHVIV